MSLRNKSRVKIVTYDGIQASSTYCGKTEILERFEVVPVDPEQTTIKKEKAQQSISIPGEEEVILLIPNRQP